MNTHPQSLLQILELELPLCKNELGMALRLKPLLHALVSDEAAVALLGLQKIGPFDGFLLLFLVHAGLEPVMESLEVEA